MNPSTPSVRPLSALRIQLFGPLYVEVQGKPLPRVRTRSVEWLLALLVLRHGRPVDRSWLAGTLWPDSDEPQALANLRNDLMHLRKALGEEAGRITSPGRDTLRLDLQEADVDLITFDAGIEAKDAATQRAAVVLSRGVLLEGCYEPWVAPEREAREQACLRALQRLAEQSEAAAELSEALALYQRALALDALNASVQQGLMRVLAASGDAPAALMRYRDFRSHLRAEMNLEPDAEITALFRKIRDEARRSASSAPLASAVSSAEKPVSRQSLFSGRASVPHPLTTLLGRDQAVRAISELVTTSRLVSLIGGGGVGKTRLSIQVAGEVMDAFPAGTAFIALASLSIPDLLPSFLADALGIAAAGATEPKLLQSLVEGFSHHSLLLVLDNCEHLIEVVAAAAQFLLERCPNLHILTTSRQRLGLTGEIVWRIPSLSCPDPSQLSPQGFDAIESVLAYPAVQLFIERARMVRPGYQVKVWEEAVAVAQICRHLDGIPLAIELAAGRAGTLTAGQIAARLGDRFRLLKGGSRGALSRHQTLRALIDWSYDLLTPEECALLRRSCVFAGGWTLEAAEQVGAGESSEEWEVLDLLTSLADKSLVIAETSGENTRYRLLETVRQYARERLAESGETFVIRVRHRDYFLKRVEEIAPELTGREQAHWLDVLEEEHDNLRQVLTFSLEDEKRGEAGLRLGAVLGKFWAIRGHYNEGRQYLAALRSHPGAQAPTKARAEVLAASGDFARTQGDYASALSQYEECLTIFRALGDKRGIAKSLTSLGLLARRQDDYTAARSLLEESLTLFQELGDKNATANTLSNLGLVASEQGDFRAACSLMEEGLMFFRELGNTNGVASILGNLGLVAKGRGEYASARSLTEESLTLFRELGNKNGIANALGNLGMIFQEQGENALAHAPLEESLTIYRELGDQDGIVNSLNSLGLVAAGKPQQAAQLLGASFALKESIASPLSEEEIVWYATRRTALNDIAEETVVTTGWEAGYAMTYEQILKFATEETNGLQASED